MELRQMPRAWPAAAGIVLVLAACAGEDVVAETSTSLVVPTAVETTTTALPAPTVDQTPPTTLAATTTPVEVATTTTEPGQGDVRIEVTYRSGEVSVDENRFPVSLGSVVDILIDSDTPVEIHVHGYDILFPIPAGSPTVIRFEATIPGVFEVELEGAHQLLFELEVS